MPPTPARGSKKKQTSETMKATSTPINREEPKEEDLPANAFSATSLGPSTGGVADGHLAAAGCGTNTANSNTPPCHGCKQLFSGTMKCSRCETVFYCGRDCQVSHWAAGHKNECKQIKEQNEEVAKRVLDNFLNDVVGWARLDASVAYKAAVRQGLHNMIVKVMKLDKAKIVDRWRKCRGEFVLYTPCVMMILFRGQCTEGLGAKKSVFDVGFDGRRIEGYVTSHPDALDAWLQASVQLNRDVADRVTQRFPLLHRKVHNAAEKVWDGWIMVFMGAIVARAILSPFPIPTAEGAMVGGGESAEQQRKRREVHVRGIVTALGEALRLVYNGEGPDENAHIYCSVFKVCAMVHVRTQEHGINIDVEGILNLDEVQEAIFQFVEIPSAKRMIEKGAMLNRQEHLDVMEMAERQLAAWY